MRKYRLRAVIFTRWLGFLQELSCILQYYTYTVRLNRGANLALKLAMISFDLTSWTLKTAQVSIMDILEQEGLGISLRKYQFTRLTRPDPPVWSRERTKRSKKLLQISCNIRNTVYRNIKRKASLKTPLSNTLIYDYQEGGARHLSAERLKSLPHQFGTFHTRQGGAEVERWVEGIGEGRVDFSPVHI